MLMKELCDDEKKRCFGGNKEFYASYHDNGGTLMQSRSIGDFQSRL